MLPINEDTEESTELALLLRPNISGVLFSLVSGSQGFSGPEEFGRDRRSVCNHGLNIGSIGTILEQTAAMTQLPDNIKTKHQ